MTENFECKGRWKLPEQNDWINGFLSFTPETGARLELFGTFNNLLDHSNKKIILGETNVGDISLIDSFCRRTGERSSIYEPAFIFTEQHFQNYKEICFRKVVFRLFNFYQWLNIKGVNYSLNENGEYSISYKKPDDIVFKINEICSGTISFDSPASFNGIYNNINIEEQAYITLMYDEKTHFQTILREVSKFKDLITFFTYEQSYPLAITFKDDDFKKTYSQRISGDKFIKCLYQHTNFSKQHKLKRHGNYLTNYKDISSCFPDIVSNWYNFYGNQESTVQLTLLGFKNIRLFTDDQFVDNVKALEIFHRHTHNNHRINPEDYNRKVKKVLDSVDLEKDDLQWLSDKLKYGNEPSLKKRIQELLTNYENLFLTREINNKSKFSQLVADNRNYYTHYGSYLKDKHLSGIDLLFLNKKVKGLLYSCILMHIGIDPEAFENNLLTLLEQSINE